jgi:hypothetical protein
MSTNKKSSARAIDEPLTEPEGDLLDMDQHARALANYLKQDRKLPFTMGIFGEWGEGKTTMVNFLRRHLKPTRPMTDEEPPQPAEGPPRPLNFVMFSAWPYTTSEKLWRALILAIAKELYQVGPAEKKKNESDKSGGAGTNNSRPDLMDKLAGFLHADLFRKKQPPAKLGRFEDLRNRLDEIDYGQISKRTPQESLDQEAVMSAVVGGALSVLGTVSPLAAGIRSFIGEPTFKSVPAEAASKSETAGKPREPLQRFKEIFLEILEAKAGNDPVYVFIDDLDRAQPDVALDIMESISIALSEGDCVYIVAVDQRLIEQGLRLRYRELFEQEQEREIETKGQEYLEKIIQFRTKVPSRTPEQTQRLIAAEFPHWTPAADIIRSIAGNNPRRVKQYCQRLSFQNMIGSPFTVGSGPADENAGEVAPEQESTGAEEIDPPQNAERFRF